MAAASAMPPATTGLPTTKARPGQLSITPISAASSPGSAASPGSTLSTPTSASTTTPQLAIKPATAAIQSKAMAAVALATPGPPKCSITSKEWVIPPRPKPGRKPATDTPPTKRKAQNRAAQRAFRERRAARVGELEEQLDEQREEYERTETELRNQVHSLNGEVQSLRDHCGSLESLLEKERAARSRTENELAALQRRWREETTSLLARKNSLPPLGGRTGSTSTHHLASQPPSHRNSVASHASEHRHSTAFSISQIISPPDSTNTVAAPDTSSAAADPAGCGSCSATGPCACVDDVLSTNSASCGHCSIGTKCECLEAVLKGPTRSTESDLKRRPSSSSPHAPDEKRQKSDAYPNEIDFTSLFAKKPTTTTTTTSTSTPAAVPPPPPDDFQPLPPATIPPRDPCGFCSEGTYCMCAEAAAAAAASSSSSSSQTLAPMGSQVQTPPPSDTDVGSAMEVTSTGAIKLPGIRSLHRTPIPPAPRKTGGGCGPGGPGTCAQCIADPKSGLFCRSLAAANATARASASASSSNSPADSGCCGGKGGGGGCCKSRDTAAIPSASGLGVSLSCADAYKTLSSHRNFERAADEIGTWLPKLRAISQDYGGPSPRAPIEVETASIMSVLKGFDVRFGKNV